MDAKLLFWTAALVNLGVLCGFAFAGIRYVRRGEVARHRRAMKIATALLFAFLAAYVLKVVFLGREDQSLWTSLDVWVLRVHELFVMWMIGGGAVAWWQSRKLGASRVVTHDPEDPLPDASVVRAHRLAGRSAVIGSLLAFVLAVGVLIGMFARVR